MSFLPLGVPQLKQNKRLKVAAQSRPVLEELTPGVTSCFAPGPFTDGRRAHVLPHSLTLQMKHGYLEQYYRFLWLSERCWEPC